MKLYVVRHGETAVNVKNLVNSWNMIGLNDKGRRQAKIASQEINDKEIDLIICSPLLRTRQTCKLINNNKIKVIYDKRVIERNAGLMQLKKIDTIDFNVWYDPTKNMVYEDSEGFKSVLERVGEFIQEIKVMYENKNILIVTHGDVCKAFNAIINNIDDVDTIKAFDQQNCEVKMYEIY